MEPAPFKTCHQDKVTEVQQDPYVEEQLPQTLEYLAPLSLSPLSLKCKPPMFHCITLCVSLQGGIWHDICLLFLKPKFGTKDSYVESEYVAWGFPGQQIPSTAAQNWGLLSLLEGRVLTGMISCLFISCHDKSPRISTAPSGRHTICVPVTDCKKNNE